MHTDNPGIYVCGTPRGGTSCVAGILHHLGVDMGDIPKNKPNGYFTFEDMQAAKWVRPMGRELGERTLSFMSGANSARDFRGYLEMREKAANGKPWGCKLGVNYPLSDPHPETLPVRWVFVDRPLEVSIRSDAAKTKPDDSVKRAMQIAGYWAGKEWLFKLIADTPSAYLACRVDLSEMMNEDALILGLYESLGLDEIYGNSEPETDAAWDFYSPGMLGDWAP